MSNFAIKSSIVPSHPYSIQQVNNGSFNSDFALRGPIPTTQIPDIVAVIFGRQAIG